MLLRLIIAFFIISIANPVRALDFYGANIADRDAPSSFMKYGIYGFRATITRVSIDSPADRAGFNQGDIILSINKKDVKRTSELSRFTTDMIKLHVFSGSERKTLTINRLAIETEKAARISAERKEATASNTDSYVDEQPNNSPALKFNDAYLEKKFGKSTYVQPKTENYRIVNQQRIYQAPQTSHPSPGYVSSGDVIESRIDGAFEGWSGETIFKLANGQIWEQSSYAYTYHYAYRPEVIIYSSGGGYKLRVDGVDSTINVIRLK
ncbi:MAG: PDZ domain-containing protein [Desulfuromonadaceae bacterium]|nr:PDZ domain-containing protein [Desulfuromonadaceae bacterium]